MQIAATITSKALEDAAKISGGVNLKPCVDVNSVSLSFGGQCVLRNVTFTLRTSELVLLRGDNGSGKTSLLNILSGLIKPTSGSVKLRLKNAWVEPHRVGPVKLARLGVGRLWQDIRLFPTMTVLENVLAATPRMIGANPLFALAAMPLMLRQERQAREMAMNNLELVGMQDRAASSCDMLSGGQMKRVAIARLLQMEADLLLLDEPLAGLDRDSTEALIRDLDRLCKRQSKTFLVVEHRHEHFSGVADRQLSLRSNGVE
jgi:branched-chain amino acid transport system ATP-binding protein